MYRPLIEGVPSYFPAMLSDTDRSVKYDAAIEKAIGEFKQRQRRAPVVLDLGCGTGVLTLLALRHGAAKVVAIDVNRDMCDLCEWNVDQERQDGWGVVETIHGNQYTKPYDMLVSELLGTTGCSESMFEYVEQTLEYIRQFPEGIYCVPRTLEVTAAWYNVRLPDPLRPILDVVCYWDGNSSVELMHTRDGVFLHYLEPERVSNVTTLCSEEYLTSHPIQTQHRRVEFVPTKPLGADSFLVIEWRAELWEGVVLENTIDWYTAVAPANAATRSTNWGLLCTKPFTEDQEPTSFRATIGWDSAVPEIKLKI